MTDNSTPDGSDANAKNQATPPPTPPAAGETAPTGETPAPGETPPAGQTPAAGQTPPAAATPSGDAPVSPQPPSPPPADAPPAYAPAAAATGPAAPGTAAPAYAAQPATVPANRGKGLAITALIIGIFALLGVAIPILNFFSAFLAIVGLVLGVIALTRSTSKGLPLSGTIVSGIALLLSLVFIVVYIVGFNNVVNEVGNDTLIIEEQPAEEEPIAEEPSTDGDVGTRDNPAPLGTTIELSEFGESTYEITLGPSTLDATAIVVEANSFNDPPAEGLQYALLPVTVTYVGAESGTPWFDITIEFVSAAGTTHTEGDAFAVAPEPTLMDINELFTGASGTGNIVVAIPTDNAAGGTWRVSTFFGDPFFFTAE